MDEPPRSPAAVPAALMQDVDRAIYTIEGMQRELNQAEILGNLAQYVYDPASGRATESYHPFTVVLSQDCDLAQAFDNPATVNEVLVFEVHTEEEVRAAVQGGKDFDRLVKNLNERFQYLEAVPPELDLSGLGTPPLFIDFKRFFAVRPSEVYRQCTLAHGAQRRCRLQSPYREHLQARAAFYLQRVMLPHMHRKPRQGSDP